MESSPLEVGSHGWLHGHKLCHPNCQQTEYNEKFHVITYITYNWYWSFFFNGMAARHFCTWLKATRLLLCTASVREILGVIWAMVWLICERFPLVWILRIRRLQVWMGVKLCRKGPQDCIVGSVRPFSVQNFNICIFNMVTSPLDAEGQLCLVLNNLLSFLLQCVGGVVVLSLIYRSFLTALPSICTIARLIHRCYVLGINKFCLRVLLDL